MTFALFLRKAERMQGNQDLLATDACVAAEGGQILSLGKQRGSWGSNERSDGMEVKEQETP